MSFTIDKFSMETYKKNFFIPVNYIVKINKKNQCHYWSLNLTLPGERDNFIPTCLRITLYFNDVKVNDLIFLSSQC